MKETSISDYMTKRVITFSPETSLRDAIKTLLDKKISGAPVIDSSGKLVGVLSEKDCIGVLFGDSYFETPEENRVKDFMQSGVETVHESSTIMQVAEKFNKLHFRRFPVVDDMGSVKGVISRRDVIKAIVDRKWQPFT